ncbi:tripartite tricarboxylate transporter substrate binding protein [Pelagibius sp.]|uniref:Bug family tripartite tricarboxylate transporter substrate binding protein n=1 Tax=Pelagibius sp. TaxID=1931238 RepID=UPI00261DAD8D|nr:tripartite tricarboxylate transporter substrate binding protein [Pelagibius sp.]
MNTLRTLAAAAATLLLPVGIAAAGDFPSQPVEVVTHASAGGGTDTTARTLLIRARKELGVDAFVQIKKGGGGAVAMSYASGKPADGHTLMAITPTHLITMARGRAPIGIDDVKGVVRSTDDPIIVVAQKTTGITSIEELVSASAASPIKWGGTQAGGIDHIAAMTFAKKSGAKVAYVPFDGGGAIITNLMGGNIQAAGLNYGEAVDGIESGDFVPLAVMSSTRLAALPDTPTLEEVGIQGANFSTVRGIIVMTETPDERVAVLEKKLLSAMKHGTFQAYLTGIGLDASSVGGAEAWNAQIREMYDNIYVALGELGLRK